jgi:predicted kinase
MEAIIFIGLQASGKSSFYKERFFNTHVRLNLDMLRTRRRERLLLEACIAAKQRFVIDNTNPTPADRAVYISAAKAAGFRVIGYYFQTRVAECIRRNETRKGPARVPVKAITGTSRRLKPPAVEEGFDMLHSVRLADSGFTVEEWRNAV